MFLARTLVAVTERLVRLTAFLAVLTSMLPLMILCLLARRVYKHWRRWWLITAAQEAFEFTCEVGDVMRTAARRAALVVLEAIAGAASLGLLVALCEPGDREAPGLGILVGAGLGLLVGLANHGPITRAARCRNRES